MGESGPTEMSFDAVAADVTDASGSAGSYYTRNHASGLIDDVRLWTSNAYTGAMMLTDAMVTSAYTNNQFYDPATLTVPQYLALHLPFHESSSSYFWQLQDVIGSKPATVTWNPDSNAIVYSVGPWESRIPSDTGTLPPKVKCNFLKAYFVYGSYVGQVPYPYMHPGPDSATTALTAYAPVTDNPTASTTTVYYGDTLNLGTIEPSSVPQGTSSGLITVTWAAGNEQ